MRQKLGHFGTKRVILSLSRCFFLFLNIIFMVHRRMSHSRILGYVANLFSSFRSYRLQDIAQICTQENRERGGWEGICYVYHMRYTKSAFAIRINLDDPSERHFGTQPQLPARHAASPDSRASFPGIHTAVFLYRSPLLLWPHKCYEVLYRYCCYVYYIYSIQLSNTAAPMRLQLPTLGSRNSEPVRISPFQRISTIKG